jgi:hypothetical protein
MEILPMDWKHIVTFLAFVGMTVLLLRGNHRVLPTPKTNAEEDISLSIIPRDINLGRIINQDSVKCRVGFENRGEQVVTITNITGSCACILSSPDKKTYKPKERGEIAVEVDLRRQPPGSHYYNVRIDYQEGLVGHSTGVSLRLEKMASLSIIPRVIPLTVVEDKLGRASFRLLFGAQSNINIMRIETSSPSLRIVPVPNNNIPPDGFICKCYEANCDSSALKLGSYDERITFITDDPAMPKLEANVRIRKIPRITVTPQNIRLRKRDDGVLPNANLYIKDYLLTPVERKIPFLTGHAYNTA